MESFADRVKNRRLELGLKQGQVAKLSGLKQPDISKIELGKILETTKLLGLAQALACNPIWLSTGKGEKTGPNPTFPPPKNPFQLLDAVDLIAERINEIDDLEARELIGARLQTMARAPDSEKSRNAVIQALAWADEVKRAKASERNAA